MVHQVQVFSSYHSYVHFLLYVDFFREDRKLCGFLLPRLRWGRIKTDKKQQEKKRKREE